MDKKKKRKLTPIQKKFCELYIISLNGAEAAREAGYSKKGAKVKGSQLLALVNVAAYIKLLMDERAKKVEATAENVLRHLNILRNSKINDYITIETFPKWINDKPASDYNQIEIEKLIEGGAKVVTEQTVRFKDFSELTEEQLMCIESIKEGKQGIELKLHGKNWTIDQINKHIGFYEKDNHQSTAPSSPPSITFIDMHKEEKK